MTKDLEQQMRTQHDELKRIRERQDYLEKRLNIQSAVNGQSLDIEAKLSEIREVLDEIKKAIVKDL